MRERAASHDARKPRPLATLTVTLLVLLAVRDHSARSPTWCCGRSPSAGTSRTSCRVTWGVRYWECGVPSDRRRDGLARDLDLDRVLTVVVCARGVDPGRLRAGAAAAAVRALIMMRVPAAAGVPERARSTSTSRASSTARPATARSPASCSCTPRMASSIGVDHAGGVRGGRLATSSSRRATSAPSPMRTLLRP